MMPQGPGEAALFPAEGVVLPFFLLISFRASEGCWYSGGPERPSFTVPAICCGPGSTPAPSPAWSYGLAIFPHTVLRKRGIVAQE